VILLLLVLAAMPFVASADTLDPTWAGGYWDDDDFDYVILLVTDFKAALPAVESPFEPIQHVIGVLPTLRVSAPLVERPAPFHRRGPPFV